MSKDENKMMDPGAREQRDGVVHVNRQRVCWAAKTLVAEVDALFPDVPVEYSNLDGRNTALDVTFDLTVLDPSDTSLLVTLLDLTESDSRIATVVMEDQGSTVSFISNPVTQDSRAPFGLSDAMLVLDEEREQ